MNTVLERIIKDISSMNIKEIKKENKQKEIYNSKVNELKKGSNKHYYKSQEHFLKYEWSWII